MAGKKNTNSTPPEFEALKNVSDMLNGMVNNGVLEELKKVRMIADRMQPKFSKRILIGANKATATLGQQDNVMLDFDDAVEGKKFYDSLTPIQDVSNGNK
jgi:hypothetical protein